MSGRKKRNTVIDAVAKWGLTQTKGFFYWDIPVSLLEEYNPKVICCRMMACARIKTKGRIIKTITPCGRVHNVRRMFVLEVRTENRGVSIPVRGTCEQKDGSVDVVEFESVTEAGRLGGFVSSSIDKCLQGKLKKHGRS